MGRFEFACEPKGEVNYINIDTKFRRCQKWKAEKDMGKKESQAKETNGKRRPSWSPGIYFSHLFLVMYFVRVWKRREAGGGRAGTRDSMGLFYFFLLSFSFERVVVFLPGEREMGGTMERMGEFSLLVMIPGAGK